MGKIRRKIPPKPIIGTATILDRGFDTDEMMRYVVFMFDPPLRGEKTRRILLGRIDTDFLPVAHTEESELALATRYCRFEGYRLILDEDELEGPEGLDEREA